MLAAHDPAETTLFFTGLVGAALFLPVIPFIWTSPSTLLGWLLLPALAVVSKEVVLGQSGGGRLAAKG